MRQQRQIERGHRAGQIRRWAERTGTNFAVHALCTSAADQSKIQIVDIIIRPQGSDRAVMGRSFKDLKNYQRYPAE
jgi:hypothetical protein